MREQTRAESVRAKGKSEGPRAPRGGGQGMVGTRPEPALHAQWERAEGDAGRCSHGRGGMGAPTGPRGAGRPEGSRSPVCSGGTSSRNHFAGGPGRAAHLPAPTLPKSSHGARPRMTVRREHDGPCPALGLCSVSADRPFPPHAARGSLPTWRRLSPSHLILPSSAPSHSTPLTQRLTYF